MKKILLIGLLLAAALGTFAYFYPKAKVAVSQDEIIPASLAEARPDSQLPDMEKPIDPEPAATMPAPDDQPLEQAPRAAAGHFEVSGRDAGHDDDARADHPGFGKAREQKLWGIFRERGSDLARSILVKKILCRVDTCIVEAESRDGDADRFQSLMFALPKQYPWLGNKIDVTTAQNNPSSARFVYFHETDK